jgi:hypothetical protein
MQPTTDFTIFDGQLLVDWNKTPSPITDIRGVERPLTKSTGRRVEQFVTLDGSEKVFHLDATGPLAGIEMTTGDGLTIQGGPTFTTILFVEKQTLGNTWMVIARP